MNNSKSTIYIVCGVHNEINHIKRLLKCFDNQTFRNYKLVIVDDGSTDDTENYIRQKYPDAILIRGEGNLWWTGSLFVAVEKILQIAHDNDFILTINNDCTVEKDYLQNIYRCSQKYRDSIIGSLVIDIKDKETIADAGVKIHWENYRFENIGPKKISQIKNFETVEKNIDTLSTKGTLYPIKVFESVGNFDRKHLPHYISDYEFACRAKKRGFKLLLYYNAKVYNEIDRTGMGINLKEKVSFTEMIELLFSRRSRINIFDHFWFIVLCCPRRYIWKNIEILLHKFTDMFSRTL